MIISLQDVLHYPGIHMNESKRWGHWIGCKQSTTPSWSIKDPVENREGENCRIDAISVEWAELEKSTAFLTWDLEGKRRRTLSGRGWIDLGQALRKEIQTERKRTGGGTREGWLNVRRHRGLFFKQAIIIYPVIHLTASHPSPGHCSLTPSSPAIIFWYCRYIY